MKRISAIILVLICLFSCSKFHKEAVLSNKETVLLNSDRNDWLLRTKGYVQWKPNNKDFALLDQILCEAIKEGEFYFLHKPQKKSIDSFYRQYVPFVNEKEQRIIEINAFCEILDIASPSVNKSKELQKETWKQNYVDVMDGGQCYWQLEVNIDEKTYKPIEINQPAPQKLSNY